MDDGLNAVADDIPSVCNALFIILLWEANSSAVYVVVPLDELEELEELDDDELDELDVLEELSSSSSPLEQDTKSNDTARRAEIIHFAFFHKKAS